MARHGGTPAGGVNRPAFSEADAQARRRLVDWAQDIGLTASSDAIGNLFLRREGSDGDLAPVMTGSHLDSQPTGGKFDGTYGVLAGLEALEAIARSGIETRHPLEVVVWVNEEGSRFQPGTMGSGIFTGEMDLAAVLKVVDATGIAVADALPHYLAATPGLPQHSSAYPPAAFLEAHIEQGPLLEAEGHSVGVVTHVQGLRWFAIEVTGEAAHAGTTPEALRRDAFMAAHDLVAALNERLHDPEDVLRFTIGRFEVSPGSPNTIPAKVFFTIDLRHPDNRVLTRLTKQIEEICAVGPRGCSVSCATTENQPATVFHDRVTACLGRWAAALQLAHSSMVSGAGHDAMHLARVCPSGMIFVPCQAGISHNEAESATAADLAAGARLLAAALVDLAGG